MVLTSAQAGAFPPGLPVGVVHYNSENQPMVLPLADLSALRMLRLFSYPNELSALTPVPQDAARQGGGASLANHRRAGHHRGAWF